MVATVAQARHVWPKTTHTSELVWYFCKLFICHVILDRPHLTIAVAVIRERGSSIIGKADQCPEAVRRQLVRVRESLGYDGFPFRHITADKDGHGVRPG